ncbi:MAG: SRPBCC family protein [Actinobacteria bacterium]|nr:SRPBCC family protein [Actinomycetota bacterium]MCL5447224.1 SRPBCC family protein [Actinomycetota bacterium]
MPDVSTASVLVNAPVAICYEVVVDFEHYPEWVSDLKEVIVHSTDDAGRPEEVAFRAAAFGRSTSYTLKYDYTHSPEVVAWNLVEGDLTTILDGSYKFESIDSTRTEVTYALEVELKVPLPGFVKRRAQSRIVHSALEDLKARVESLAG